MKWLATALATIVAMSVSVYSQAPAPGRGRGSIGPRPQAGPPDRPPVDEAAADRGRALYGVECITCHGSTARGTEAAPSLIRSIVVLNDRYGSLLVPFFRKGHPMQSGRPSAGLTDEQAVDLMHFLRQRINDTLRGSAVFTVGDIVTGHALAGKAYFEGAGRCTTCHTATGDLAGVATRVPAPVDIQQRMLFPARRAGRGAQPSRTDILVTVERGSGPPLSGVLIQEDDFFATFRDPTGAVRVVRKVPGVVVKTTDPLGAHQGLLERMTDENMHDLVAYLVTLK